MHVYKGQALAGANTACFDSEHKRINEIVNISE